MTERWKPKAKEPYWITAFNEVAKSTWLDDGVDESRWQSGNCFKTKEAAEAAIEKVKALLLSLHETATECNQPVTDCNQLPKLTADVFNRPDCPEWAKYAAVDGDGKARFHAEEPLVPSKCNGNWWWCSKGNDGFIGGEFDASDWKNSLIERPAKLPDWCKVDAIAWHKRCGYFKVTYIDDVSKRVDIQRVEDDSKGYLSFHVICTEAAQARPRPYNEYEMKSLVGRTVDSDYGSVCLVTKFYATSEGGEVVVDGIYYNANKLLDEFTINNKPCGKLEHLENGEWVE